MLGTAPQVGFWILLEVRDQWEPKNLEANSLPEVATDWISNVEAKAISLGLLPRVQFIRHRRRPADPLTVMTSREGKLMRQEINDYDELADIDPFDEDKPMPECDEILYFVCTHGRRDVCCSRQGLPTWQRLNEISNGRAWQTTHLGGHRFAANVLTMPTARMYGRLTSHEVDEFFTEIESGEVPTRLLRGNAFLPPDAQACEPKILADDGRYLSVSDTEVVYETSNGTRTTPIPPKVEFETLASCKDSEMKTVVVYQTAI